MGMRFLKSRKDLVLRILYEVGEGDTFEIISRNVYGVDTKAELLKQANPSILLLKPGQILTIPKPRISFL